MSLVAIITGASSGIGRATAIYLAKKGIEVVLVARNQNKLNEVEYEIKSFGGKSISICLDVSIAIEFESMVSKIIEHYGRIDILINNAGIMPLSWLQDLNIEEASLAVDTNIKGVLHGIHYVLPHMININNGIIINVGSTASYEIPPFGVVYSATKHAVSAITKGLYKELIMKKYNIRVGLMCPGPVNTNITNNGNKNLTSMFDTEYIAEQLYNFINDKAEPRFSELIMYP
ncbi:SDR family oxidoreductase [Priestia megaterium]